MAQREGAGQTTLMRERTADGLRVYVPVPAKVNLSLHVVGQRSDGYHLLDSVVVFTVRAFDRLCVTFGPQPTAEPSLTVSGPFADALPPGRDNAVMAAARCVGGIAAIQLDKGLPVASGLGGGAADAAAVLRAAIMAGQLSEAEAFARAAVLGADVPVCLFGRACRMEGIGHKLTPLRTARLPALLVNPGVPVETRTVFQRLARKNNGGLGNATGFRTVEDAAAFTAATRNDLMAPAVAEAPVIGDAVRAVARQSGCRGARMSGSGASVFGLFDSEPAAAEAAKVMTRTHGWWASATPIAASDPPINAMMSGGAPPIC